MYRSSAPHPAEVLVNVDDVSVDVVRVGCVSHFGSNHRWFGAGPNIRSPGDLSGRNFSQDFFEWGEFFWARLVLLGILRIMLFSVPF